MGMDSFRKANNILIGDGVILVFTFGISSPFARTPTSIHLLSWSVALFPCSVVNKLHSVSRFNWGQAWARDVAAAASFCIRRGAEIII
jgi:hypothetical protein